jgi:hypothetical protein
MLAQAHTALPAGAGLFRITGSSRIQNPQLQRKKPWSQMHRHFIRLGTSHVSDAYILFNHFLMPNTIMITYSAQARPHPLSTQH